MNKYTVFKRKIIYAVLILVIGASVPPTIVGDTMKNVPLDIARTSVKLNTNINNGSLSGYVHDTLMKPIKGALVRVFFHETYEEDYTDSSGYYRVTNIPICFCLKNATASRSGYRTEWALLAIGENTIYDFVLTHLPGYNGSLSGYVTDKSMNPIEGVRVRVSFHETYEEDSTDSSGCYYINNIPICFCLKNCTASKEGYHTEWVLLAIDENTTHDFILTQNKSYLVFPRNQQILTYVYLWLLARFLFP